MAQAMRGLVLRVLRLRDGIKFVVPTLSGLLGDYNPAEPVHIRWVGENLSLDLPSEPLLILTGSQRALLRGLVLLDEDAAVVLHDHRGRFRISGSIIQRSRNQ